MAQIEVNNINKTFPIYNSDGTSFYGLEIKKATIESTIMSLGDKISGDVYYPSNDLNFTLQEYVEYEGVHYYLVSPPTIVREGLVKDNSQLKGMTKYSLVFYHPMYMLGNLPFTDKAVTNNEENYLSQNKVFSWIGNLFDFVEKLNVNLEYTEWLVVANISINDTTQQQKASKLSEVLSFDKNFISDALKTAYDTWEIPFTITSIDRVVMVEGQQVHKSFLIEFGLPSQEILDGQGQPYIFKFGQGVGLKNNSRTPKNNKIVTRIVGSGSERNIPFGYPQIRWWGDQSWEWTEYENNDPTQQPTSTAYPIYKGIVGGQYVKLIKHPFTRKTLMPSVYVQSVFNKVSPYLERTLPSGEIVANPDYNRQGEIIDYYDAIDTQETQYSNPINPNAPSVEIHQFEDIYPRLGESAIVTAYPINTNNTSGKIVETKLISSYILNTLIPAKNTSTNQNEKYAIQGLISFLTLIDANEMPEQTAYHESSTGGAYTYACVVQRKGMGYAGVWVVDYTSDNFNAKEEVVDSLHTPAWDDTMDDKGEYVQSYFKMQLPRLDFDIYACASITEQMQINMRSGACLGCTFNIMVDWDDYKKNFYDVDGNFSPNGQQRDLTKYPNSALGSIEVICQKDLDTFGSLMPNKFQFPKTNDTFVILGISLPHSYIASAESELDDAMKEYMLENNIHYFDYPLKFDEYFLTKHQDILSQIKNNNIVRFKYCGTNMALYIKQITIKYGDGVLPQWDITLTDDVEIVLSKIGQVTDDVSRMRVQLSELQKYYSENIFTLIQEKLSKVSDDIAQGRITFQQGLDVLGRLVMSDEICSSGFTSGLGGNGWRIDQLGNAEVESLKVRSYLEVIELLINRLQAQEGDTLFSDNDQIEKVDKFVDETDGSISYILSLKEKWDGYITSQMYGNILKGTINTLAAEQAGVSDYEWAVAQYSSSVNPMEKGYYERSGEEGSYTYIPTTDTAMSPTKTYYYHPTVENDGSNSYYTSWMRVIATHATNNTLGVNQIQVVLYGDDYEDPVTGEIHHEIPAGKNFEPCQLMSIARWGCIAYNASDAAEYAAEGLDTQEKITASIKRRQQLFYISTSEGRIVKLNGVDAPILKDGNYGTTIGELPDFVKDYPSVQERIVTGGDYLYAQGVVVGDFIKIDKSGLPIPTVVFCGEWVDGSQIQNPTPRNGIYYYNQWNDNAQQYEIHEVRHNGGRWQCLQSQPVNVSGTLHYFEPKWNSPYWRLVDGNDNLTIEFVSSKGYSFRRGAVDTLITPHLFYGNVDITSEVDEQYWSWTRTEEYPTQEDEVRDETWNATHTRQKTLHLTNSEMPLSWATTNKAIFTCTVVLNDGKTTRIIDNQIIS